MKLKHRPARQRIAILAKHESRARSSALRAAATLAIDATSIASAREVPAMLWGRSGGRGISRERQERKDDDLARFPRVHVALPITCLERFAAFCTAGPDATKMISIDVQFR
jgi:hypothetical protein